MYKYHLQEKCLSDMDIDYQAWVSFTGGMFIRHVYYLQVCLSQNDMDIICRKDVYHTWISFSGGMSIPVQKDPGKDCYSGLQTRPGFPSYQSWLILHGS